MNIDRSIANRALAAVGQPCLSSFDKQSKAYLMVKKFYLSTMLESLSTIKWTSAIKRLPLKKAEIDNYTDYSLVYRLPADCGKIIELADKSFYILEGKYIYTNAFNPILVYITTGKLSNEQFEKKKEAALAAGTQLDEEYPEYDPPEYEPMFYEAFELRLASKLALELSGQVKLHQMLLQEAAMIELSGARNSKSLHAGKKQGNNWWID